MSVQMQEAHKVAEKIDKNLRADDPRLRRAVMIQHEEGTQLFFMYAFLMKWKNWIFVFTEHHSFHIYDKDDLNGYWEFNFHNEPIEKVKK